MGKLNSVFLNGKAVLLNWYSFSNILNKFVKFPLTNEIKHAKIILFLKKKYPLLTLSWQRKHKVKYQFYIVIDSGFGFF